MCFSILSTIVTLGTAPTTLSATSPFLKNKIVGILHQCDCLIDLKYKKLIVCCHLPSKGAFMKSLAFILLLSSLSLTTNAAFHCTESATTTVLKFVKNKPKKFFPSLKG